MRSATARSATSASWKARKNAGTLIQIKAARRAAALACCPCNRERAMPTETVIRRRRHHCAFVAVRRRAGLCGPDRRRGVLTRTRPSDYVRFPELRRGRDGGFIAA